MANPSNLSSRLAALAQIGIALAQEDKLNDWK
jgi:hypothetical protein